MKSNPDNVAIELDEFNMAAPTRSFSVHLPKHLRHGLLSGQPSALIELDPEVSTRSLDSDDDQIWRVYGRPSEDRVVKNLFAEFEDRSSQEANKHMVIYANELDEGPSGGFETATYSQFVTDIANHIKKAVGEPLYIHVREKGTVERFSLELDSDEPVSIGIDFINGRRLLQHDERLQFLEDKVDSELSRGFFMASLDHVAGALSKIGANIESGKKFAQATDENVEILRREINVLKCG